MSTETLTAAELAELARLEAAARRAPWEVVDRPEEKDSLVGMIWTRNNGHGYWDQDSTVLDHDTAAFIAAIRNAVPRLLAAAARDSAENTPNGDSLTPSESRGYDMGRRAGIAAVSHELARVRVAALAEAEQVCRERAAACQSVFSAPLSDGATKAQARYCVSAVTACADAIRALVDKG